MSRPPTKYAYNVRQGNDQDIDDTSFKRAMGFPDFALEANGKKVCQCILRDIPSRTDVFQITDFETKETEKKKGHGRYFENWLEGLAKNVDVLGCGLTMPREVRRNSFGQK